MPSLPDANCVLWLLSYPFFSTWVAAFAQFSQHVQGCEKHTMFAWAPTFFMLYILHRHGIVANFLWPLKAAVLYCRPVSWKVVSRPDSGIGCRSTALETTFPLLHKLNLNITNQQFTSLYQHSTFYTRKYNCQQIFLVGKGQKNVLNYQAVGNNKFHWKKKSF